MKVGATEHRNSTVWVCLSQACVITHLMKGISLNPQPDVAQRDESNGAAYKAYTETVGLSILVPTRIVLGYLDWLRAGDRCNRLSLRTRPEECQRRNKGTALNRVETRHHTPR